MSVYLSRPPRTALRTATAAGAAALALLGLSACGGNDDPYDGPLPQLTQAQGAALSATCASLSTFSFDKTAITAATVIAAGAVTSGGQPIAEHCKVTGKMHERTVGTDVYAIGFEMRMPKDWNGRFLYQGNGGTDGVVSNAYGGFSGGGMLQNGLQQGFAVISSDAGHNAAQNPLFGLDPQARLDYGYQAVGKLTPMAKALIKAAYGKNPDRSYIGGTSNGGRHAMVAASRYAADYDGVVAVSPGFNLPKAAVAQLYGAQQWSKVATDQTNLQTAFTAAERLMVSTKILEKCDALDGSTDGLVQDIAACRTAFDLSRDVPTCPGARDNTCLTADQKTAVSNVYKGARNTKGEALYASWPYDPGMRANGWATWKFVSSVGNTRDPVAVGFIFSTPPAPASMAATAASTLAYALNFNFDTDAPKIFATDATYVESGMSFMTPPTPTKLDALRSKGAKMIVVHGASDGVFSPDDTASWYTSLNANYNGHAGNFSRFFIVPGMGHSSGGPATDQFDALAAVVNWVEKGQAPESLVAAARGAGNAGGTNADVPLDWSPSRTRPLCPYPLVARYKSGDKEVAASFACEK